MPRKSQADAGAESDAEKPPPGAEERLPDSSDSKPPNDPISDLLNLDHEAAKESEIQENVNRHIENAVRQHPVAAQYTVLVLYDSVAIGRSDADRIYRALSRHIDSRPILLVVTSPGGDVASAYLIAKLCREHAPDHFDVAVPRQAKSAATLIACGADRIHMGSLSELGPIDPQFGQIPALALKNSVEHLATLTQLYPQAAEMFASYLARSLRVEALGFYERVAESAVQYAIRLLDKRNKAGLRRPADIAASLVYDYKDHGFVIDATEATEIFGDSVVTINTPEYALANDVYSALKFAEWLVGWRFSCDLAFTGNTEMGCLVTRRVANSY